LGGVVYAAVVLGLGLLLILKGTTVPDIQLASRTGQYLFMAEWFSQNQEGSKAATWARTALDLDPDNPLIWGALGHYLFESRRYEESELWIRKSLEAQPLSRHSPALRGDLGAICFQTGRVEEAEVLLRRSLAQLPGNPELWSRLGDLLEQTGRSEEAAEAYRRRAELLED
jgi:Flp pilus assembly protein TadD